MWILPNNLHTSAFVPDTEALSLDLSESSQLCAQSLFVRSKPLPARIWLQKWKRDLWTQHLFGRILKPSHGQSFVTAWTSSLEVTHASHSAQLGSASEPTTRDIFGPTSQAAFNFSDQSSVFLRTSRDTFPWGCATSCANWENWVTERRGAYSARLKLARLTSESGSMYWPTATARDWKGCGNAVPRKDGKHRLDTLEAVVMFGRAGQESPSTDGNRVGSLNPNWVETLMGLPTGWTDCASSATELCL